MKPIRLAGHALQAEGAPYDLNEDGGLSRTGLNWNLTSGAGRALCECGAYSEVLPSSTQRKQWHRDHKDGLRGSEPVVSR